jgi:hypothetical protein
MSESPVLPAPTRRIFPGVAASRHNCSRTSSPPPAPPAAAASVFTRSPARTRSIATRALSLDPRKRDSKERAMGFEPTTSSLGSWHSTTELRPQHRPRFDKHLRAATSLFCHYLFQPKRGILQNSLIIPSLDVEARPMAKRDRPQKPYQTSCSTA